MNFAGRIKKLQKHLEQLNCRAILVENVIDLYYLTGIQLSVGKLL